MVAFSRILWYFVTEYTKYTAERGGEDETDHHTFSGDRVRAGAVRDGGRGGHKRHYRYEDRLRGRRGGQLPDHPDRDH